MKAVPDHLVPIEVEREFLAGIFRAADVLEDNPAHAGAVAALVLAERLDAENFAYREHREILAAVQWCIRSEGSAHPILVRDELRRRRCYEALRLLPAAIEYGLAPVASIGHHAQRIREAARGRREWAGVLDRQAELLEGSS